MPSALELSNMRPRAVRGEFVPEEFRNNYDPESIHHGQQGGNRELMRALNDLAYLWHRHRPAAILLADAWAEFSVLAQGDNECFNGFVYNDWNQTTPEAAASIFRRTADPECAEAIENLEELGRANMALDWLAASQDRHDGRWAGRKSVMVGGRGFSTDSRTGHPFGSQVTGDTQAGNLAAAGAGEVGFLGQSGDLELALLESGFDSLWAHLTPAERELGRILMEWDGEATPARLEALELAQRWYAEGPRIVSSVGSITILIFEGGKVWLMQNPPSDGSTSPMYGKAYWRDRARRPFGGWWSDLPYELDPHVIFLTADPHARNTGADGRGQVDLEDLEIRAMRNDGTHWNPATERFEQGPNVVPIDGMGDLVAHLEVTRSELKAVYLAGVTEPPPPPRVKPKNLTVRAGRNLAFALEAEAYKVVDLLQDGLRFEPGAKRLRKARRLITKALNHLS